MEDDNATEISNSMESIFEVSQEEYINLFDQFETNMFFKGHTIQQWLEILRINTLRNEFSLADLEKYTLKIAYLTDITVTNYSLASANYNGLKKSVERAMMSAKASILNEYEMLRQKKPSVDQLETLAYNKTDQLQLNYAISEMFYNFWKIQYDKIYLLNQRVTSLNVLKNIESKGINLT